MNRPHLMLVLATSAAIGLTGCVNRGGSGGGDAQAQAAAIQSAVLGGASVRPSGVGNQRQAAAVWDLYNQQVAQATASWQDDPRLRAFLDQQARRRPRPNDARVVDGRVVDGRLLDGRELEGPPPLAARPRTRDLGDIAGDAVDQAVDSVTGGGRPREQR